MILFALPPHTVETVPAWNGAPLRSWRWTIEAGLLYVGITDQVRFGEHREWGSAVRYAWIGLSRRNWHVGFHHTYYDGPHHALWIGPFYLNWAPHWCDVCMPPEEEDTSGAVADFVEAVLVAAMGVSP